MPIEAIGADRARASSSRRPVVMAVLVFVASASALVIELAAARLMAPVVGMSLYTWTAIITVILTGFAAGHWLGGALAARAGDSGQACRWLSVSLVTTGLTAALAVMLSGSGADFVAWVGGVRLTTVLMLSTVLFLAPSLAAGIASPLATAIAVEGLGSEPRARVLARMFAASAAGAILGTLAAGYLLVPWLGAAGTLLLIAVTQGGLALIAWRHGAGGLPGLLTGGAVLAATVLAAMVIARPICDHESQYYCLKQVDTTVLTGYPSRGLEIDGWLHSVEALDGDDGLYIESHDFVDALTRRERGGLAGLRALFIGGGGLTVPELWRRSGDVNRLLVLEIDPAVTRFAVETLSVTARAPLEIKHVDGRAGLRLPPPDRRFDVIYNDAYTGLTMPAHLVTREFHGEIADRLSDEGLYVVNMIDAPRQPRFLASLVATLRRSFDAVEIWRREGVGKGRRRMHYGLVARQRASGFSVLISARGTLRTWQRLDRVETAALFDGTTAMVLSDDLAPVDRLLANFCSFRFLRAVSIDLARSDAC